LIIIFFSKNFNRRRPSRQNLFSNLVDLFRLADLPRLILQPSVASTKIFYNFSARASCSFLATMLSQKTSQQFMPNKNLLATPYAFTFSKSSCSPLRWKSLHGWDCRPQLTAVPGLFGWESLNGWDFLGHNLLLSRASFGGNPLMDGIF
jgi:hypothetical protein